MRRLNEYIAQANFVKDTLRNKLSRLKHAFNFFSTIIPSGNFLEITPEDFRKYMFSIDKMDITVKTKQRYRQALKDYADFLSKELYSRNKQPVYDYSFIFSDRYYKFKKYQFLQNDFFIEYEDSIKLLDWAKYSQPPLIYYCIAIHITTGCRVKGVLGLTRNDVDLNRRMLFMHEKAQDSIYFLGINLVEPLKHYLAYIPESQEKLFPISEQKYNQRLKRYDEEMHSNVFRDFVNSLWEDQGVEVGIRDILQNRTPTGVNAKFYLKRYKNWLRRRKKYDSIYPFSGYNF